MTTFGGFVPARHTVIETGPLWTMAVNRNQNLLGKCIIVVNRQCDAVVELSEAEWLDLRAGLRRLTGALTVLFGPDQFNSVFLMNVDAQVHLHVIPRYAGQREWAGLEFVDPDWGRSFGTTLRLLDPVLLEMMASQIAGALRD